MSRVVVRLITVFACESQPVVIEGLRLALESTPHLVLVGAAEPERALPAITELRPDVVLISPPEEPEAAFPFLEQLREACPTARPVLWVSNPDLIDAARARQLGVCGILGRTLPAGVLLDCLTTAGRGELWREPDGRPAFAAPRVWPRLTPRERQVVGLLCRGLKNRQIAEALAIAPGTVKVHLMHIFEKTGARNRYELVLGARRLAAAEHGDPAGDGARPE